jgi:hypothetical protein
MSVTIIGLSGEVQLKQRRAGQAGSKSKRMGAGMPSTNTRLKPAKSGVSINEINAMHPVKSKRIGKMRKCAICPFKTRFVGVDINDFNGLDPLKSKQNGKIKPGKTRENRAAATAQYKQVLWGSYTPLPSISI